MTVYRHRFGGLGPAGDVWQCVIHSASDLVIDTVHTQFENQFIADLLSTMQPLWNANTGVTFDVTDELDAVTGKTIDQRVGAPVGPGTSVAQASPQGLAIVVSWVTPLPGKHGRGRIFLPAPVVTAFNANGLLSTATQTAVAGGMESARSDFSLYSTPALYDKVHKTSTTITGVRVSDKPSYQRRRLNKIAPAYVHG